MLSSLLKDHIANQPSKKELQEKRKNDALRSVGLLTDAVVDSLNSKVSLAYSNQRKLDVEAKKLQAGLTLMSDQTAQWLKLIESFNQALKEIGDIETWAKAMHVDMQAINCTLENAYKNKA